MTLCLLCLSSTMKHKTKSIRTPTRPSVFYILLCVTWHFISFLKNSVYITSSEKTKDCKVVDQNNTNGERRDTILHSVRPVVRISIITGMTIKGFSESNDNTRYSVIRLIGQLYGQLIRPAIIIIHTTLCVTIRMYQRQEVFIR